MKRMILVVSCCISMAVAAAAQDKGEQKYKLMSERLDQQGKELDAQISSLNTKLAGIIKKYDLLKTTGVRILPYQMTYVIGQNFIEMEKHTFIKDDIYARDITGIQVKKTKIYTDGQSISQIESQIYDQDYYSGMMNIVKIVDPSPMSEGTDDIVFTYILRGKIVLDNKKLGEIKNTTVSPIRNDLKREFLIPHLSYFEDSLLYIAEAYYKGLKDAESGMSDFLKKSLK